MPNHAPAAPPRGRDDLIRYVLDWLKPVAGPGKPEELWRAVAMLLDKLEGKPPGDYFYGMHGITDWKQCPEVRFNFASYCFGETNTPLESLFVAVARGKTVQEFLAQQRSVSPVQVAAVLEHAVFTICVGTNTRYDS